MVIGIGTIVIGTMVIGIGTIVIGTMVIGIGTMVIGTVIGTMVIVIVIVRVIPSVIVFALEGHASAVVNTRDTFTLATLETSVGHDVVDLGRRVGQPRGVGVGARGGDVDTSGHDNSHDSTARFGIYFSLVPGAMKGQSRVEVPHVLADTKDSAGVQGATAEAAALGRSIAAGVANHLSKQPPRPIHPFGRILALGRIVHSLEETGSNSVTAFSTKHIDRN
jgi:hypothetical protein